MTAARINLNDPEFKARLQAMRHRVTAPTDTYAFVHRGMWVADCAYPACANCEPLEPGQSKVYCRDCHYIAHVIWPADAEAIDLVLSVRPVPGTRHWAPAGHRQAVACGFPEGQSVEDLLEENEENL